MQGKQLGHVRLLMLVQVLKYVDALALIKISCNFAR